MTEPTDAEIDEIYRSTFLAMPKVARQPPQTVPPMVRDFARAVLARWGTPPVVAGDPQPSAEGPPEVWLQLHCDCLPHERTEPVDYTGGDVTWCWHAIHSDDVRYVRADLVTQPTQAQAGAVPLTRERVKAILTECGYDGASAQHRADFINGLRHGEAAHGIKGGQHG